MTPQFVSLMGSRKSSDSFLLPKFDRGFEVFKCPRDRFLDLAPFGPIVGSSTCHRKTIWDVNFDNMFDEDVEEDEDDDLNPKE